MKFAHSLTALALALALAPTSLAGACSSTSSSPGAPDATGDATSDASSSDGAADLPTPPTSADVLAPGPYAVGQRTLDLVDSSRPTPANGSYAGADSRQLTTEVWYPRSSTADAARDAALAESGGPWPLVVYSHGFMSSRLENPDLAAHLASYGLVVAAPDFPLTGTFAPGGPNVADVVNQPGDVRFVIDQMLARSADPGDPLAGAVDSAHIGLMGTSLGAFTSLVTAFYEGERDPRVSAVVSAAAPGCYLPDGFFDAARVPLLLIHGDLDRVVPYAENGPPTYAAAHAPKLLVTLVGGTHTALAGSATDLLAHLSNPESLGCGALAGSSSLDADSLVAIGQALGVDDPAAVVAACPAPCSDTSPLPPAMNAAREQELLHLSAVPFLRAYLAGDTQSLRFLTDAFAAENPDATLAVDLGE